MEEMEEERKDPEVEHYISEEGDAIVDGAQSFGLENDAESEDVESDSIVCRHVVGHPSRADLLQHPDSHRLLL